MMIDRYIIMIEGSILSICLMLIVKKSPSEVSDFRGLKPILRYNHVTLI